MYLEKKERKMKILKKTTKKICCLKKKILPLQPRLEKCTYIDRKLRK